MVYRSGSGTHNLARTNFKEFFSVLWLVLDYCLLLLKVVHWLHHYHFLRVYTKPRIICEIKRYVRYQNFFKFLLRSNATCK